MALTQETSKMSEEPLVLDDAEELENDAAPSNATLASSNATLASSNATLASSGVIFTSVDVEGDGAALESGVEGAIGRRAVEERRGVGEERCGTVGQINQEPRCKYWATRSFTRTAHLFVYSGLLTSLAPSAALSRLLAHFTHSLACGTMID